MRIHTLLISTVLVLLASCGAPQEEKKPDEGADAAPACDFSLDNLDGHVFVQSKLGDDGKTWEDDVLARAKFYKEGDKLKAKYNTRALLDMYTYTCVKSQDGAGVDCWEDNPNPADFCRTLIANLGDAGCTPEAIRQVTGLPEDKAKAGYDEVMAELKKLPKKEYEDMKQVFNSPNNQLRGIFHVKMAKKECRLTLTDNYQTMTFGQWREMGNVVGSARFVTSDKDLVFEHCREADNLVALSSADGWAKPGESVKSFKAGQPIPFRYVGDEDLKPAPGCTYTMDTWSQYSPLAKGVPVEPDAKGRLNWSFSETYPKPGRFVVHMYRYKACNGGAPELLPVSCQGVKVE